MPRAVSQAPAKPTWTNRGARALTGSLTVARTTTGAGREVQLPSYELFQAAVDDVEAA